jgi:opacity protein-like surface antigen
MMKKAMFALAGVAVFATVGTASAQLPISVEVRADAAIPTGDFADAVDAAPSFGVNAALGLARGFAVYGGYSRTAFELQDLDEEAVDQGFSAGVTLGIPAARLGVQPYIGAGVLIHDLKIEDGPDLDSDLGFEVGAGVALPIASNVRLTPGIGYRRYSTELPALLGSVKTDVQYFTAGVGLNISF